MAEDADTTKHQHVEYFGRDAPSSANIMHRGLFAPPPGVDDNEFLWPSIQSNLSQWALPSMLCHNNTPSIPYEPPKRYHLHAETESESPIGSIENGAQSTLGTPLSGSSIQTPPDIFTASSPAVLDITFEDRMVHDLDQLAHKPQPPLVTHTMAGEEARWDGLRDIIRYFYLTQNKPLKEVQDHMANQYSFYAS